MIAVGFRTRTRPSNVFGATRFGYRALYSMFELYADRRRDRLLPMAGVGVMHVALAWLLISGLGADMVRGVSESLQTFNVEPPPPPPPPIEQAAPAVERAAPDEPAPAAPSAPAGT